MLPRRQTPRSFRTSRSGLKEVLAGSQEQFLAAVGMESLKRRDDRIEEKRRRLRPERTRIIFVSCATTLGENFLENDRR